jgi:glycosyltransferase involved in cell wall biosynthesis
MLPGLTRVALLCNESRDRVDAIREASYRLAAALRDEGLDAAAVLRGDDGSWHSDSEHWHDVQAVGRSHDVLVLQYNPFLYGRRGFAPWLIRDFLRLRLGRRRPVVLVYVHETAMPMVGLRKSLMGAWQRVQLRALRFEADGLLATTEAWAKDLGPRASQVPVGSTLPDMRRRRYAARERLGVGEETLVVATLSSGHESHLTDYVAAALAELAEHRTLFMLALGAGARPVPVTGVECLRPGLLPADAVAELLAAADLFLAPLIDGVSARRTSVMAALQHGVPVVTTDGHLTDSFLRGSGALALSPVGDVSAFAATAGEFADAQRRLELGSAGRALYERFFDWPIAARALVVALEKAQ